MDVSYTCSGSPQDGWVCNAADAPVWGFWNRQPTSLHAALPARSVDGERAVRLTARDTQGVLDGTACAGRHTLATVTGVQVLETEFSESNFEFRIPNRNIFQSTSNRSRYNHHHLYQDRLLVDCGDFKNVFFLSGYTFKPGVASRFDHKAKLIFLNTLFAVPLVSGCLRLRLRLTVCLIRTLPSRVAQQHEHTTHTEAGLMCILRTVLPQARNNRGGAAAATVAPTAMAAASTPRYSRAQLSKRSSSNKQEPVRGSVFIT
jgi:hypothetical protein